MSLVAARVWDITSMWHEFEQMSGKLTLEVACHPALTSLGRDMRQVMNVTVQAMDTMIHVVHP